MTSQMIFIHLFLVHLPAHRSQNEFLIKIASSSFSNVLEYFGIKSYIDLDSFHDSHTQFFLRIEDFFPSIMKKEIDWKKRSSELPQPWEREVFYNWHFIRIRKFLFLWFLNYEFVSFLSYFLWKCCMKAELNSLWCTPSSNFFC